jgi:hypothetical protein
LHPLQDSAVGLCSHNQKISSEPFYFGQDCLRGVQFALRHAGENSLGAALIEMTNDGIARTAILLGLSQRLLDQRASPYGRATLGPATRRNYW